MSATRTESSQRRLRAAPVHQAIRLEMVTIIWMIIEAGASIVAGIGARSLLLVAFGIDSGIELISAMVLFCRLKRETFGGSAGIERWRKLNVKLRE